MSIKGFNKFNKYYDAPLNVLLVLITESDHIALVPRVDLDCLNIYTKDKSPFSYKTNVWKNIYTDFFMEILILTDATIT